MDNTSTYMPYPNMSRYPSTQLSASSDDLLLDLPGRTTAAAAAPTTTARAGDASSSQRRVNSKAVILIGGPKQGTRFRPLSQPHCPKPLFPIAGVPMVYHQMDAAAQVPGMSEIILIGLFPEHDLRQFVRAASDKLRLPVRYLQERQLIPLGTAGGVYQFRDVILRGNPDCVFVIHCDVCADFPLQEMINYHFSVNSTTHMTIMSVTAKRGQACNYGCLVADESGFVQHYAEKPSSYVSDDINCGVYLLSPAIFDDMKKVYLSHLDDPSDQSEAISLENDIIIPLTGSGRLFMFRTKTFWSQIKTAASTIYANRHYLANMRAKDPGLLASSEDGFTVVGDVRVHSTAEIDPSAKLGPNVTIGPNTHIGPGARIKDAIILENVHIAAHSCILNSIVDRNSVIGSWARVEGAPVTANPNDPTTDVPMKPLFNSQGRLEPSITIVGEEVSIADEIMVLNTIVLPHKNLSTSYKNEIIL